MDSTQQSGHEDNWPALITNHLVERFGEQVDAVLLYGSWLRGNKQTVLDFYVLLDQYSRLPNRFHAFANRLLPPNVYHVSLQHQQTVVAAKYAVVTTTAFSRAINHGFHSYFWARFAQPFEVTHVRNEELRGEIMQFSLSCAERMVEETAPLFSGDFSAESLWAKALQLTYNSELRSEGAGKALELVNYNREHFGVLTGRIVEQSDNLESVVNGLRCNASDAQRSRCARRWKLRQAWGKLLSVLRLFKAAFTFNQPLAYVLWKVERHSGIREEATPLQHRLPLIFAWPVLWRLYRRGGFR